MSVDAQADRSSIHNVWIGNPFICPAAEDADSGFLQVIYLIKPLIMS